MEDAHTRIFGNSGEESRKIQLFPLLFGEFNRPVSLMVISVKSDILLKFWLSCLLDQIVEMSDNDETTIVENQGKKNCQ